VKEHGVEFIQGLLLAFACNGHPHAVLPAATALVGPGQADPHGRAWESPGQGGHATMGRRPDRCSDPESGLSINAWNASRTRPSSCWPCRALGAIDDYLNARTGFGIRGRHKIIWQLWWRLSWRSTSRTTSASTASASLCRQLRGHQHDPAPGDRPEDRIGGDPVHPGRHLRHRRASNGVN